MARGWPKYAVFFGGRGALNLVAWASACGGWPMHLLEGGVNEMSSLSIEEGEQDVKESNATGEGGNREQLGETDEAVG